MQDLIEARRSSLTPPGKVAIVSHDAGGAEILSSWIRRNPRENLLVLEGPARNIFQSKIGLDRETTLPQALSSCDWVLTGASWQSNLENLAIKLAKEKGMFVATFMDHWRHYRARLLRNDELIVPDEVWIGDDYAYQFAKT